MSTKLSKKIIQTKLEKCARTSLKDDQVLLVFDQRKLQDNAKTILEICSRFHTRFYFPVKSFPSAKAISLVSAYCHGFEYSSIAEMAKFPSKQKSLWFNHNWGHYPKMKSSAAILCLQTIDEIISSPEADHKLAARINPSSLSPNESSLKSRFGLWHKDLVRLQKARPGICAFNIHPLAPETSPEASLLRIISCYRLLTKLGFHVRTLNVGGGWGKTRFEGLKFTLQTLRKTLPPYVELIVEPGRLVSDNAGYLISPGEVFAHHSEPQLRLQASKTCHFEWCSPSLIFGLGRQRKPVRPTKSAELVNVFGATSFEGDRIYPASIKPVTGRHAWVFGGVSGYSFALNRSFNGVKEAKLEFI
jgi:diaminopimelate decarboxylase